MSAGDLSRKSLGRKLTKIEQAMSPILSTLAAQCSREHAMTDRSQQQRSRTARVRGTTDLFRLLHLARRSERIRSLTGDVQVNVSYFSFFLADRLQALGYPISGADDELRAGHRRYNFGWYRLADAAQLKRMCVDDDGREYEFGVPPPLVRNELIEQMRAEAETLLPPALLYAGL
jgi:hypothetical protein